MLGSMTVRGPRRVLAALSVVLSGAVLLAGCGTASAPSPPSGVDGLTVPTPSPRAVDFVANVDNPWSPLPVGRTWRYDVVDVRGEHPLTVTAEPGPVVDGVRTTARVSVEQGSRTTDLYAQDRRGNVWWLGSSGERGAWRAGVDGARAGLAMPARPRVGDGFRAAYLPGVVEDVVTVLALDAAVTLPVGSYADLLLTETASPLTAGPRQAYYARGTGLVEEDATGRTLRLRQVTG